MLSQHVSLEIVVRSTVRKIQTRFADGDGLGEKGNDSFPIALLISAQWMDAYTGPDQWTTAGQLNCREGRGPINSGGEDQPNARSFRPREHPSQFDGSVAIEMAVAIRKRHAQTRMYELTSSPCLKAGDSCSSFQVNDWLQALLPPVRRTGSRSIPKRFYPTE